MKPTTRRLGRGLGAFLDFGPADESGAAKVAEVISDSESASVLETSRQPAPAAKPVSAPKAPAAPPAPPRATVPVPQPAPAPVPAPVPVTRAAVAAVDDRPFIDDDVVELTFPDVELE